MHFRQSPVAIAESAFDRLRATNVHPLWTSPCLGAQPDLAPIAEAENFIVEQETASTFGGISGIAFRETTGLCPNGRIKFVYQVEALKLRGIVRAEKGFQMRNQVVHWEVTGKDGVALQKFFGDLFDWEYDTHNQMNYGVVGDPAKGLSGGVGQTPDGSAGLAIFYVGVDDVSAYLEKTVSLGGKVFMPETEVMDGVVIGLFADPDGHMIGLAKDHE